MNLKKRWSCMYLPTGKISAVLVYLERRKSRKFVGKLSYNFEEKSYVFQYDEKYLRLKLIPLGPELPLSRKKISSKKLFEPFVDRIPSKENPAYKDYCAAEGINVGETDPFILLTTIGKKGPSSFIFESKQQKIFTAEDLKAFREELQLTTKEFSLGFSIAEKTLISIERGQAGGRDVMKRLELYVLFPAVALFEFRRNCAQIHGEKRRLVEQILSQKIRTSVKTRDVLRPDLK